MLESSLEKLKQENNALVTQHQSELEATNKELFSQTASLKREKENHQGTTKLLATLREEKELATKKLEELASELKEKTALAVEKAELGSKLQEKISQLEQEGLKLRETMQAKEQELTDRLAQEAEKLKTMVTQNVDLETKLAQTTEELNKQATQGKTALKELKQQLERKLQDQTILTAETQEKLKTAQNTIAQYKKEAEELNASLLAAQQNPDSKLPEIQKVLAAEMVKVEAGLKAKLKEQGTSLDALKKLVMELKQEIRTPTEAEKPADQQQDSSEKSDTEK